MLRLRTLEPYEETELDVLYINKSWTDSDSFPTPSGTHIPVTLRQSLSMVASAYDPIGSQLKLQLQGRLLVRRAHEEPKKENGRGINWEGHKSKELYSNLC